MRGDPQRQPDLCRDTGLPPVLCDTGSDPLTHPHPQQLRDQPILIEDHPRTSPLQRTQARNHITADVTADGGISSVFLVHTRTLRPPTDKFLT
ncbi:hypothetical protein TTY48_07090 [Tsukamurella sp. TY48]|nr:hypothetical protein TTY48_07090 [Tsukamurella sp. TY48]